jgi:AhpD family alkylhydroperoxidase
LVEVRVSQINGCGFCLAMHADQARAAGVAQTKLDTVAGWAEDPSFTARERAALAIAEAVTHLDRGVPDDIWHAAAAAFTEEELADLLYAVGLINLYNRVNVAAQFPADLWRDHGLGGLRPAEQ